MTKAKRLRTSIVFPRTGFKIGAGSVFNLAGKYFDCIYSSSNEIADKKAIYNDWAIVGQELRDVIEKNPQDLSLENA